MFKKLIMFASLFTIVNNMHSAAAVAQNTDYITKATCDDLANANFTGKCAICQEELSDLNLLFDGQNWYKANCPNRLAHPHIFHRDCILGWVAINDAKTCPICRGQMEVIHTPNLASLTRDGNIEEVQLLINSGVDLDIKDIYGITALMWASRKNYIDIAELLIRNNANLDIQDNYGRTALAFAAEDDYYNNYETVKLLIDNHANLNIQDINGNTALMKACAVHPRVADLLIEKGANVNIKNQRGVSALRAANANARSHIIQMLKDRKAIE